MKLFQILLFLMFSINVIGQEAKTNIINLPIKFKNGCGPFPASLSAITFEIKDANNPWSKTYVLTKGVPENWKDVKKGMLYIDPYQFVYQNYLAGNISDPFYKEIQKGWQWNPDKAKLSTKSVKCFVSVASGIDQTGKEWTIVDQNNNLDYSDDEAFLPVAFIPGKSVDSLSGNYIDISYERVSNEKIVRSKIPLLIEKSPSSLWYCFPQYAVAYFMKSGIRHELSIGPDKPNFASSKIILMNDSLINKKTNAGLLVSEGEYISINRTIYKYQGVNLSKGILRLKKIDKKETNLFSTQINFKAINFQGREFTTQEPISLEKYRGKYLFLDFWATWCGPCIKEIPNLKNAYEKLDSAKVQILGIVGEDKAASLRKFITKENIMWPQILSDETNEIVESYRILSYPASFLINPEGIIIAKNLRGQDLYKVITGLMN